MQSEKAATGQRVLHPGQDYCRLCILQRPALPYGHDHMDGPCLSPVDSLSSVQWRGDLPVSVPPEMRISEECMRYPGRFVPQRRHIHLGPSHYPVPEACSPPCYSWRELRTCRWEWPPDPRLSTCACVWEIHRDCGCSRQWHHHPMPTEPFNGSPIMQLPQAKVKGQRYYSEARYVSEEQYWDCSSESYHRDVQSQGHDWDNSDVSGYNGHCERRHVRFQGQDDGNRCSSPDISGPTSPTKTHCNGSPAFFPTEVPQSQFRSSRTSRSSLPARRPQGGETHLGQAWRPEFGAIQNRRKSDSKSQGSVREQIKQVVTELEDVLGGLKQVQLEMKEVVQQIDILTSNIDLGEEEQGPSNGLLQNPSHQGSRFGVVALIHTSNRDEESPQIDDTQPNVKSRTTHSLSDHSIAAVLSSRANSHFPSKSHTIPSSPVSPDAVESAGIKRMNHASAKETMGSKNTANGDCIQTRPPRVKVKDLQHQRSRMDHMAITKSPEPSFPRTHNQKPPPYPQNGHVKMYPQDTNHSSNAMKMPPFSGKQKHLNSTMV